MSYKYLVLVLPLLISCIGIENRIHLKEDGSGKVDILYTLSPYFLSLLENPGDHEKIPLPVTKRDFERSCFGVEGLELKSYHIKEEKGEIVVRAVILFDSIGLLNTLYGQEPPAFILDGKEMVINIPYMQEGASVDSLVMMEEFLGDYNLLYRIDVPGKILSVKGGGIDGGGNFFYTISLMDVLKLKKRKQVALNW